MLRMDAEPCCAWTRSHAAHARANAAPLRLRLVANRMPKDKAMQAVAEARATAKSKGHVIQPGTLVAAEWVIMVTSLARAEYPTDKVLELYRLRRGEARLRTTAHRDRLQTDEVPGRAQRPTRRMPSGRQGLGAVPPDRRPVDRGAAQRNR